jgi:hypothetical protein
MTIIKFKPTDKIFGKRATFVVIDDFEPKVHNRHHKSAPADAVYVGRGSPWGNPYVIGQHGTREEVIELYRVNVLPKLDLAPLRGKHLVCFCKPQACHGDLLLEAANG